MVWGPQCHSGEGTDAKLGLPREGGNLLKASDLASQGRSQAAGPRLSQAVPGIVWVVLGRGGGERAVQLALNLAALARMADPQGSSQGPQPDVPKLVRGSGLSGCF